MPVEEVFELMVRPDSVNSIMALVFGERQRCPGSRRLSSFSANERLLELRANNIAAAANISFTN